MKKLVLLTVALLMVLTSCAKKDDAAKPAATDSKAKTKYVTIGTGGVTGVYYPTGGAISKMINAKKDAYGIRASVESTGGSVYNINAVLSGDLEFGIAQSDRQYQAAFGTAEWKDKGPQKDLRSVFSVHPESVTLLASEETKAKDIKGLKGKIVNLGNPGSGQLQNAKDALAAFGIAETDIKAEYVKAVEAPGLLQDEKIDAFFYTVGHPAGNIKEATSGRIKVRILDITGPEVDALIAKYPYYAHSVIPQKFYTGAVNTEDIKTFGVKATFVTSVKVSDDVVYAIVKEVFDNFDKFKKLHPAYSVLTKESMLKGLSAPVHSGALKYYKENDLIKYIDPKLVK